MDIEKEKENFISLLRLSYNALKATEKLPFFDDGNPERITIHQEILSKYGFNSKDFWEIICPSLKESGYLKSYNDPIKLSIIFERSLENDSEYKNLREKRSDLSMSLPSGYSLAKTILNKSTEELLESMVLFGEEKRNIKNIENQIKEIDEKLQNIREFKKENLYHEFIVNEEKFLNQDDKVLKDKYMSFDNIKTIIYKSKSRHVFQSDVGKKGLPLRFFKLLWKLRHEKKGEKIRKGERKDEHYYARELGLSLIDKGFYNSRNTESKTVMSNLIKGLNRIFKDKGFPSKIKTKGGILLEVENS